MLSMPLETIDPADFLTDNVFRQDQFLAELDRYDWNKLAGKRVLVRGCQSALIPPWAMMALMARLVGRARSISYGNEHDNIIIWRKGKSA